METFNETLMDHINISADLFVQDNESVSLKGVLRGIHIQNNPPQGKLVRVTKGMIIDVVVNLNKNSVQFGEFEAFVLSEKNNSMLWIPPGFGHSFLSLEENTRVTYKTTAKWNSNSEQTVSVFDEKIAIPWNHYAEEHNIDTLIVSEKDMNSCISLDQYEKTNE